MAARKPGLGREHDVARAKALEELVAGTPCPLCGQPMFYPEQRLDLHHVVPIAKGGADGDRMLTHAICNRRYRDGRPRKPQAPAKCQLHRYMHRYNCGGVHDPGKGQVEPAVPRNSRPW